MFQLARRSVVFSVPNYDSPWAHIIKARQGLFGVHGYPDSPTKQWIRKSQISDCTNIKYKCHSLASRIQDGFFGLMKFSLRRILRYNLFIIARIGLTDWK